MKKHPLRGKAAAIAGVLALLTGLIPLMPARAAADMPDFSALGAVGCLTQAQTQDAAERIYTALANHASTVSLGTDSATCIPAGAEEMDSLMNVYITVVAGFDEGILAEKNSIGYQLGSSRNTGDYMKTIVIYYLVDTKKLDSVYRSTIAQLDAISAQVQDDWSDVEKALFLHEYLAVHYNYDNDYDSYATEDEEYLCHTAYGMLTRGKAVCEGYAWLYNVLLHREGIESYIVSCVSMGHAWNLVNIDGSWAHVDITWDDDYQGHAGLLEHISFLKSDEAMRQSNHTGTDWEISTGTSTFDMHVTDRFDNGFWSNSLAAVVPYQGQWLAIIPDQKSANVGWFDLFNYDAAKNTADCTELLSLSLNWPVLERKGYSYVDNYIVPAPRGEVLYYTTPTAIMALYQDEVCWLLDLTAEQEAAGRIYGMYIDGDMLYYDVAASPTGAVTEYGIDLTEYTLFYEKSGEPVLTEPIATETTTTTATTSTTKATTSTTKATTSTTKATTSTTKATTSTTKATTTTTKATTSTTKATTTTTKATTSTTKATTTATKATTTTTTATKPPEPVSEETTVLMPETAPVPSAPEASGDADGDGELTVRDLILVTRHLLYGQSLTESAAESADLLPDGVIDVYDLALMKRLLLLQTDAG